MRVVIDMQGAQTPASKHRGVGRYTKELVKALIDTKKDDDQIILALNGEFREETRVLRDMFSDKIGNDNIKTWQQFYDTKACFSENKNMVYAGEVVRESFLNSLNPDIIFSTNLQEGYGDSAVTSCKIVNSNALYCSTLHDVTPLLYEDKYLSDEYVREWYMSKLNHVVNSDIILTVSNYSKEKICEFLKIDTKKVHVVSNAVNISSFPSKIGNNIKNKFNIDRKFMLFVGGSDEHKNLIRLIKAYGLLPQALKDEYQLLLVGKEIKNDWYKFEDIVKKQNDLMNIVSLGYIDDTDLMELYKLCELFVFPCVAEGFGIPALEAINFGIPTIASNATSIPEVVGVEEALFNPYDEKEICDKIIDVLTNDKLRDQILFKEIEHSKIFFWENSAKKLWSIWHDYVNSINYVNGHSYNFKENCIKLLQRENYTDEQMRDIALSISESDFENNSGEIRIFLDVSATVFEDSKTGIQRVARALCQECYNIAKSSVGFNVSVIYTTPEISEYYYANDILKQIDVGYVKNDDYVRFYPRDVIVTLDLHPSVARTHVAINRYLIAKGVKVYHLICDILPVVDGRFHSKEFCIDFEENWLKSILQDSGAICISKSVMDDVINYIEHNSLDYNFKLSYSHIGADISVSLPSKGFPDNYLEILSKLEGAYNFLMVGTIEPRKGHKQILRVFDKIWSDGIDCNLIIVGKLGWQMDDFKEIISSSKYNNIKLFWLEGISDEYLEKIYKISTVLIAASECEGFGLPLIEAAINKVPILARDIKVFREVAGDYATYFEGEDDIIKDTIINWLEDYSIGKHRKSDEMPFYTWNDSAANLLKIIVEDCWLKEIKFNR